MRLISALILILLTFTSFAQDVGGYIDYMGRLVIFEAGNSRQIEKFNVSSVITRGEFAAYITSTKLLKVYHRGVKYELDESAYVDRYHTKLGFIAYNKGEILRVFDSHGRRPLSSKCSHYDVSDSIVLFKDDLAARYMVYFDGKVTEIPDLKDYKLGRATLVFSDNSDNVYFYRHGQITELPVRQPRIMDVGSDLFAFVDISTDEFIISTNTELTSILTMPPRSFKAGAGLVAYEEASGNFSVWDNGKITRLLNEPPDLYYVLDNRVVYATRSGLWVYKNGQSTRLEQTLPSTISVSSGLIAYEDQLGRLKAADIEGNVHFVSMEKVTSYNVMNEMIYFLQGFNDHHFFYKGKIY